MICSIFSNFQNIIFIRAKIQNNFFIHKKLFDNNFFSNIKRFFTYILDKFDYKMAYSRCQYQNNYKFSTIVVLMKDYLEDFRMNMKFYREKNSVSQTQLAILCDCGTGTIGGIESGKAKPSFDMIIRIAEALKITPADLFVRDSSKNKIEIKKQLKNQFEQILEKL